MTLFERAAWAHIASRGSPKTRDLYSSDLHAWLDHCHTEGVNPDEPTLESAAHFRDKLAKQYASSSLRRRLSAISSMYDAAGLVNLFKSSKRLARPEANEVSLTKEFTPEEALALIAAASDTGGKIGTRDEAILKIMHETGLRVGTVVSMRRDRLVMRNGVDLSIFVKTKKKGLVEVVFPDSAARALDAWLRAASKSDFIFPALRGRGHLGTRAINKRFAHYGKLANVPDAHPHRFRATFATEALTAGVPLHELQAAMHHSDPATTLRYDRGQRGVGVTKALAQYREKQKREK